MNEPGQPSNAATIGDRIAQRLIELGMPQRQLAERAGMTPSTLNNIVSNRRQPGIRLVEQMAIALKTDCNWLITGKPSRTLHRRASRIENLKSGREHRGFPRFRRRAEIIAKIQQHREAVKREFEIWRVQTRDAIIVSWFDLVNDPHRRPAAESLLSFFVRFLIPRNRVRRRRFHIPQSCLPRAGWTYNENPDPQRLKVLLDGISPIKLQILNDFFADLLARPATRRVAAIGMSFPGWLQARPDLQAKLEPLIEQIRVLAESGSTPPPKAVPGARQDPGVNIGGEKP